MVGEVPKLIFRARKIPIVFLQPPLFFKKKTPGVGLVFGEVPESQTYFQGRENNL